MNAFKLVCFLAALFFYSKSSAQLPAYYDLRNYGYVTSVKDQGLNCGSCWAFATCASIESAWLKQGGSTVDLSEDNLIDCHDFNEPPCAGGSFYMSQALLSRHEGPLLETTDPYSPASQNCMSNTPFPPIPTSFVEDFRLLPAIEDSIKSAIMKYGAVASTMFFTMSNYDTTSYKYYDSVIDTNDLKNPHGVTIVGWNDTISFSGTSSTGAWIIKDSYGTSWANNGYFYCAFADAGILSENAVFLVKYNVTSFPNKTHVYLHDELGWVDNYGYGSNKAYALVKYTLYPTSGYVSPQRIKRIGTYAVEGNTTIQVDLYRSKSGNTLSDHFGSASINCPHKGFYTIPMDLPTDTLASEIFIKVTYTCPTGTQNPIPVEKVEAYHTTNNFSASSQSCWLSSGGNTWTQIGSGTSFNMDACVKMYTQDDTLDIIPTSVSVNEEHELKVFPNPSRGQFQILLGAEHDVNTIIVYDCIGNIVYHQKLVDHTARIELDLNEFTSGLYTLNVYGESSSYIKKLVIEK